MLDIFLNFFQDFFFVKIIFLVLNGFYIAFLLVVYKQSHAMQNVINDGGASSMVNSIALLNIIAGVLLFVTALIIL